MTILAQTAETEDMQEGTVPTMEHLAIFQAIHLISQQTLRGTSGTMCFSWLQLLAHIVRRIAFNPQLADLSQLDYIYVCRSVNSFQNTFATPGPRPERSVFYYLTYSMDVMSTATALKPIFRKFLVFLFQLVKLVSEKIFNLSETII